MTGFEPISWLIAYKIPALFAGSFFLGETIILSAGFLIARGWFSWPLILFVTLAGTLASDVMWFYLGRFLYRKQVWHKYEAKYKRVAAFIEKRSGDRPYLSLFYIKFIYGTRILAIMYMGVRRVGLPIFLFFDALASLPLLILVLLAGWLAGKGYTSAVSIFHNFIYGLSVLVGLFILYKLIMRWVSKRVAEEVDPSGKSLD